MGETRSIAFGAGAKTAPSRSRLAKRLRAATVRERLAKRLRAATVRERLAHLFLGRSRHD